VRVLVALMLAGLAGYHVGVQSESAKDSTVQVIADVAVLHTACCVQGVQIALC
jgi:hypothetical protein